YDRPRSFLNLTASNRKWKPIDPASTGFQRLSKTSGAYYASHELAARLVVSVYGNRGIGYSLTADNTYYVESRQGASIVIPAGQRVALRLFGETGKNDYPVFVQGIQRSDDVRSYGGGLAMRLYRNVTLTAVASQTKYDSNVPGNNRSIFRITTLISA